MSVPVRRHRVGDRVHNFRTPDRLGTVTGRDAISVPYQGLARGWVLQHRIYVTWDDSGENEMITDGSLVNLAWRSR